MANNTKDTQKLSFDKQLVLSNYISTKFGYKNIDDLFALLKDDYKYDTLEADNHTKYYSELSIVIKDKQLLDKISEYDYHIVSHLEHINKERLIKIKLKYYQYLYLLFVEYYLDKYFNNKNELLAELNDFADRFHNEDFSYKLLDYKYIEDDLNSIALWSATGSGKTILMHINFLQHKYYSKNKYNKENSYILITPNERLSYQHIEELELSNINAEKFNKMHELGSDYISVIENTKLADKEGVEQIAVESLGNDNVVFVDEGHRGTKGDTWLENRNKLCEKGFSFEYSATFGQAVASNSNIFIKYAKSIIFDYSYKYFYNDGYGKDFNILNYNNTANNISADFTYMAGVLLTFYQQLRFYSNNMADCKKFDISKPLLIFVGNTVAGINNINKSDIYKVMIFIKEFLENKNNKSVTAITNILKYESGYLNKDKQDIFEGSLKYLTSKTLEAEVVYKDMLEKIFNCSSSHSILHIENIKGSDGEIALKAGENDYFGVINVGDATALFKKLQEQNVNTSESSFKDSLFAGINNDESKINILIGAKKFTEGWNSYRVSCMGLLNVGQSEGSSIIQLFGRGVRLKGYNNSLKRSSAYKKIDLSLQTPEFFNTMETLNVFGINADYMKTFNEIMRREGVDINQFLSYQMNVIRNKSYKNKKLYTIKLKDGLDYKKHADIPILHYEENINIVLDLFNTVQSASSQKIESVAHDYQEYHIPEKILPFFNYDNIYFKMQEYKNMTGSYNINITKECIIDLLNCNDKWSVIHAYNDITIINSFEDITRLENTAIMLLKKYFDKFYYKKRLEWESLHQEYVELNDDDNNNFIEDIDISINKDKQSEYESNIKELIDAVRQAQEKNTPLIKGSIALIKYAAFDAMLYYPLLYNYKNLEIKISPVSLNEGEYKFLEDLKKYIDDNKTDIQDIYVIRNQSRKGVGFFTGSGFYPDFIMWVIKDNVQHINFIDPHGISRTSIMDAKVEFYKGIKDVETRLNDNGKYNVVLNSFILSPKSINVLQKPEPQIEWEDKHVYFMDDENYIKKIFDEMK